MISTQTWPPETSDRSFSLSGAKANASDSLNDGSLFDEAPPYGSKATSYRYPDPTWALGNIELTSQGPNPTSHNLTFTSAPLTQDLDAVGYPTLRLFMSSSRTDLDVIAKLVEVPAKADAGAGARHSTIVAKGWLRASHRAILDRRFGIRHRHGVLGPLVAKQIYELELSLTPIGHRFHSGSRIRLDISCADSAVTDAIFTHVYTPDKVGQDTVHHSSDHTSCLILPILLPDMVTVEPIAS